MDLGFRKYKAIDHQRNSFLIKTYFFPRFCWNMTATAFDRKNSF